ncbi:unnamed protein product [Trichobilharzia szidati]|nr:unnamed protein product [Trichobilharzia szidati]
MVDVPLLARVSDNTDCSSSSCPTSSVSEDSVPEGYLILTFDKRKKAVIKTAVFADVSDPRFVDDFDDDDEDVFENTEEGKCYTINWQPAKSESKLSICSVKSQEEDATDETKQSLSKPLVISTDTVDKNDTSSSFKRCYGEVFWVGEDEPDIESKIVESSLEQLSSNNNNNNSLIRASPLSCDTTSITPDSTLPSSSSSESWSTMMTNASRVAGSLPYRKETLSTNSNSNHFIRKFNHNFSSYFQYKCPRSYNAHTNEHTQKMLKCDQCGKYYRNDYSLYHHICLKRKDVWKKGDVPSEVIDGQLMYFCPSCSKPFKWLGNLTRHFYVHTGQRFFRCDICSKEFFSAYQVRRHMNSHTGIRYKCPFCEKPFTCKYACAWHTRKHLTHPALKH